jgi:HTH-type transcriptional regulator/antitoxin HigA
MKPKIIKTEVEHEAALARIEEIFDAKPGTPQGDEVELLAMLVEHYEKAAFPIDLPDPLAAIQFRMDQQGLKAKDLVPYIGSAPKVSEVLNGQRNLSLTMIRNLVNGLGIPAEVLLKEPGAQLNKDSLAAEGRKLPVAEMLKRRWFAGFNGKLSEAKEQIEDLLAAFAEPLGVAALRPALNRQHIRSGSKMDEHALAAWRIRVATLALREPVAPYSPGTVTLEFLQQVVGLSYLDQGPRLAKEFLGKSGIHFVIEPHLPKTFLDGAALKLPDGSALVALTLRHDRLDNFWFTLCHELAHLALHLDKDDVDAFFDDLENTGKDKCEKEADAMASEALIPTKRWKAAKLTQQATPERVRAFAESLRISPAIPAGRIRYEKKNYTLLKDLVGAGKVRRQFEVTKV